MNIFNRKFFAGAFAAVCIVSSVGVAGVILNTNVTAVFAEEKEPMWAVKVDGETVGACATKDEAKMILQEFLDRYTTTDAKSVSFLQEVVIYETEMDEDILKNTDELRRSLDPRSENSEFALDVLTEREMTEYRVTECEVEYYDTDELYEGELQVTAEGTDTEEYVTMQVQYLNGNEILKKDMYSTIVTEGVP